MSAGTFFVVVAITLFGLGLVRLNLATDHLARLISLNVMGAGTLLVLIVLAARSEPVDPVLSALAITGLVITVAFTGVGLVLAQRIESERARAAPAQAPRAQRDHHSGAEGTGPGSGR